MMTEQKSKLIHLGKVTKAHGIKGEFKVNLFNRDESCLKKGIRLTLLPLDSESTLPQSGEVKKVSSVKFGNYTIVSLEGLSSRNDAEELIPFSVYIEEESLPPLREDEFYFKDLLALNVLDQESRKEIAVVKGFYENGAQVVLQLEGELTIDLPFVDSFFPEVNFKEGYITVIKPEEL